MEIILKNINYIYNKDTSSESHALKNVSLEFSKPQFIALCGSTGSGKSTLVQLLNGLKTPTSGNVFYDGKEVVNDKKALRDIRCRVGLVFQYPEYQLFDETVLKDVAFGPKNKGFSPEKAKEMAKEAILQVGLKEEHMEKSPFDLSGGEKRRAAIAGILAMNPEVLILDEPTAALDPVGKTQILELVKKYQCEHQVIVIMITHNMDEAAEYADRVIVMGKGKVLMDGETHEVFQHEKELIDAGLSVPQAAKLCEKLGIRNCVKIDEAVEAIVNKCSET